VTLFTSIAAFSAEVGAGCDDPETRIAGVTAKVLARAKIDDALHRIYTQLLDSRSIGAARALSPGPDAPLFGVPVAIKDNIDVAGTPTSCGRRLELDAATTSAAIVARLESLGGLVIGKTNLDEAALGASGRNPRFGRCGNPRFAQRLSGGSSSGSAAAVAAGHVLLGIGTDTLGSVRIPAAFCGVVGFKPSHGRLSMAGVAPLCPRYDSIGLLTSSLADLGEVAALLLGEDGAAQRPANQIAVLDEAALAGIAPEVARAYRYCVARLAASPDLQGGTAPPLDWGRTARAALWEVAHEFAERSAQRAVGYHALDDIDGDLGRLLSRAAGRSEKQLAAGRALLAESAATLAECLERVDALLTPTCPENAPPIEEHPSQQVAAFTAPANVAGLPAVTWSLRLATGETVSLQLIGRHGEDLRLLELTARLQRYLADAPQSGA
jgi:aspartyl-tRNA(Asn)/glutamyl-tRNA(Gln) amidotransferase subunit A